MDVLAQFTALADEWTEHFNRTGWSSITNDRLDHPSYGKLVALGMPAVPHIMERYKLDERPWWGFVLEDITGIRSMDRSEWHPVELQEFWIGWWEQKQREQGG